MHEVPAGARATSAYEAHIPSPPLTNLPLAANADYKWSARTQLAKSSVDEATGPEGFLDTYCGGAIGGPSRGAGTHTESGELFLATTP